MKKLYSYFLLTLFTGFLVSIAVDYSLYLEVFSAGIPIEDVNTIPEEHNEKSGSDTNFKNHLVPSEILLFNFYSSGRDLNDAHRFSLVENPYFDVPYSPPEVG